MLGNVFAKNFRNTVPIVALLNAAYFGVEFSTALWIQSVSLFADSIDFLEDTSINLLILVALGWSAYKRSLVGMVLAAIILAPGVATIWTAWQKFILPVPPEPVPLALVGVGALIVNFSCAVLLVRYKKDQSSLIQAAFLSARNDVLANIGIIFAGVITALTVSVWPDVIVGIGIFLINLGAARTVFLTAKSEHANSKI